MGEKDGAAGAHPSLVISVAPKYRVRSGRGAARLEWLYGSPMESVPSRYLMIRGIPVHQVGIECGSHSFDLAEPGLSRGDRLYGSRVEVDTTEGAVVKSIARVLESGPYLVLLQDVRPRTTIPRRAARDETEMSGLDVERHLDDIDSDIDQADAWKASPVAGERSPRQPWIYRTGVVEDLLLVREWSNGPIVRPVFEVLVPMMSPARLDHDVIEDYRRHPPGASSAAVAIGSLDEKDGGLFVVHYLLDGHHRMAAAAQQDRYIRLLTFFHHKDLGSALDRAAFSELLRGRAGDGDHTRRGGRQHCS